MPNYHKPSPLCVTNSDAIDAGTSCRATMRPPGPVDAWAAIEARRAAEGAVDHKARARQSIIESLRQKGIEFRTRSDWNAKEPLSKINSDWDYKAIAIHHAGNSYSCSVDSISEMRKAESTDINAFGQLSYHYAIDCKGVIYEALDIRSKGFHIENGNTGVIGLVFLADFSVRGEAGKHGPGVWYTTKNKGVRQGINELLGEQKDKLDVGYEEPTDEQYNAASKLVKTLLQFFHVKTLGGHREFAKRHGTSRPCPGIWGLILADQLREEFKLAAP